MAQFSVLAFAPREHLTLGRQREAVLAARVDGEFLDEHVLDGLQQGGTCDGLCAADAEPTTGAVPSRIHLASPAAGNSSLWTTDCTGWSDGWLVGWSRV